MNFSQKCVGSALLLLVANGVFAADKISPLSVAGAVTIDATKAKVLFDKKVVFVDIRTDKDWEAGRIPGAIHLDIKSQFTKDTLGAKVKVDQEVVFYCNGEKCLRSSDASVEAVKWGYKRVYYFRDGFPAWQNAGYPAE